MKALTHLSRLFHIGIVLFKHGLGKMILKTHLGWPFSKEQQPGRGESIRKALEELGPIFVKFGQLLSTRYDIFPEDILQELAKLQDQVPSFSSILAKKIIEESLGQPIFHLFRSFDLIPLASASISQVHAATLLDGKEVAVKVLRPHIHKIIKRDINLLRTLAKLAHRYWKRVRIFKPQEIIEEFAKVLTHELDLTREAANASQLKRNATHTPTLHIPEIYWQYTRPNILIMERIHGISITQLNALKQQGFNLNQLAKQLIDIFFKQAFQDCFFHADMHPGNIFIMKENPKAPKFILVDFGIMGILSPHDQHYLAENILAFLKRDYRRVALLHVESGWVPKTTRLDEFEAAIRAICEPILAQPLKNISFGQLLFRLLQMAAHYQVNIQPQLILLQKTLVHIESLSRYLDPDIDLWETAKPFLEKWMKAQIGFPALLRKIKIYSPYWIAKLPEIPGLLYNALTHAANIRDTYQVSLSPSLRTVKSNPNPLFSIKDICIGLLLGLSLGMLWFMIRKYF